MIKDRIEKLREWLKNSKFDAIVIPTNDPHFSEYVAQYWTSREWISGFTGSAGTVVVTDKKALLWCDSRYFVQAEIELDNTIYSVQKIGQPNTPSINSWLNNSLKKNSRVAVDGKLLSVTSFADMVKEIPNCEIVATIDPFVELWKDRPKMPKSIVRILDENVTGESIASKYSRISDSLDLKKQIYVTAVLDEIAWLLNIRGADVKFNPVVISYAVVTNKGVILFVDPEKFLADDKKMMESKGVTLKKYSDFDNFITSLKGITVVVNLNKFDVFHYNVMVNSGAIVKSEPSKFGIITELKAQKNRIELNGMHFAMINDGVALVKFNMWLERALDNQDYLTEYDLTRKLLEFRMNSPKFVGNSFNPIVGYKSNGAIIHYSPSEKGSAVIKPEGFLLLDSGGQYEYGTTDITRTIHLSNPTERERMDYTLVLKGNISLVRAVFPVGTNGYQLDILARQHLLLNGLNYMHGTGHGIGHYLNVHEGPQSIRADYNSTPLAVGMLISNEPGLYRVGEYGIRLENIIECIEHSENEFGKFLKFQTITLFPFDLKSINVGMLTIDERHWLNRYHAKVFDKLSQFLDTEERFWLSNKTKAI